MFSVYEQIISIIEIPNIIIGNYKNMDLVILILENKLPYIDQLVYN